MVVKLQGINRLMGGLAKAIASTRSRSSWSGIPRRVLMIVSYPEREEESFSAGSVRSTMAIFTPRALSAATWGLSADAGWTKHVTY